MKKTKCPATVIGRILLAVMFLVMGVVKIFQFDGTVAFTAGAGVPYAEVAVGIAIVVEVLFGLALLFNRKVTLSAQVLSVYLLIITLVMHRDIADQAQQVMFLKNLAIIGGLLVLGECNELCEKEGKTINS